MILEGVFEGLPKEWRELKRLIRKSQFDEAYLIIENDSVDISWSLRYAAARFGLVFMGISKIRRKQRGRIIILAMNNGLCGNIRYMEST